jgi:hypoxanthine phosphoribosyltransferase
MRDITALYPDLGRLAFSEEEIDGRVEELAREIETFYPEDEEILVIGLLKGAFVFTADLVRALRRPRLRVDFVVAALYGEGTDSSREVRLLYDADAPIDDSHVLLVEDVVDSGKTLNRICDSLSDKRPRSLEVCALLHKHVTTVLRHEPRWVGFDAPSDWLVGYGLDLGERYRHLPFIATVATGGKKGI